jgi:plastocyanin
LLFAAACGGGDDNGNGNGNGDNGDGLGSQPDSPQQVDAEVTEAVGGVIDIEEADNFAAPNNLKVGLGETTTIQITNVGIAVHNVRIAGVDGEWNTDDDVVSDPEFISGGGTATVEFTPTVAGTYTFRCDFHPLEQGGVIVVE